MEWITDNSAALQVIMAGVSAVVWVLYLQLFLTSYVRQRRPHILITMGAGVGLKARCFVTNLGFEPIYLSDVIVILDTTCGEERAVITDRSELSEQEMSDPAQATNQGPLTSGAFTDIGSFKTLVERVRRAGLDVRADGDLAAVDIIVVAQTAARPSFVAAQRRYLIRLDEDSGIHLYPTDVTARQICSWLGRRRILRDLSSRL